jgi:predicted phosphoadenosine phosphosulfate sulfurtransferase
VLVKVSLGVDVRTAAEQRIAWVFDRFPKICVSFSAGKDSSVMLHMVCAEARRRKVKIAVLLIDLEAQYKSTIDHALACYREYADVIEPYWISLPLVLRNAVSQYAPRWICWDPEAREAWVRQPPDFAITDPASLPFFRHAMEFEEFVDLFAHWYAAGEALACFVGIRSQESLNRFRSKASAGRRGRAERSTTSTRSTIGRPKTCGAMSPQPAAPTTRSTMRCTRLA